MLDLSHGYGGSSSRLLGLMSRFSADEMALAALQGKPLAAAARRQGLRVYEIGKHKLDPLILPRLVEVIRQGGFQVVDTQNIQSKLWGSLAAIFTGTALVSTLNSWYNLEHGGSLKGRFYTALELLTNFRLDGCIVVSDAIRQAARQAGIRDERIDLIYNAVEIDPLTIPGDSAWLKARFGLPAEAIVCTAVGRPVWAKGYEDLIRALTEVTKQEPRLHCLILGDGELRERLEHLIVEMGMKQHIHLTGFRERQEALSILKASDIFVMPSRQEGTPLALLEVNEFEREGREVTALRAAFRDYPQAQKDNIHYYLPPQENWEAYQKSLSQNARGDARRRLRRLQEKFQITFTHHQGREITWQDMETIFATNEHGRYPHLYRPASERAFQRELLERTSPHGWPEVFLLSLNGQPAAYRYGYTFANRFEDWRNGIDMRLAQHAAGKALLWLTLENCIQRGLGEIDFLRGDEDYKARWQTRERIYTQLRFVNRTRILSLLFYVWLPRLKWFIRRRR